MGIRQLRERIVGGSFEGPVDFHYRKWYQLTMAAIQHPTHHELYRKAAPLQ